MKKYIFALLLSLVTITSFATTSLSFLTKKNPPLTEKLIQTMWENKDDINNVNSIENYFIQNISTLEKTKNHSYTYNWKLARLLNFIFDIKVDDWYTTKHKKHDLTEPEKRVLKYGFNAGLQAIEQQDKGIPGHYWGSLIIARYLSVADDLTRLKHGLNTMKYMKEANALNPSYADNNIALAAYYSEFPLIAGGSNKKSLELFKKVYKFNPDNPNVLFWYARALVKDGDKAQAKVFCQRIIDNYNNSDKRNKYKQWNSRGFHYPWADLKWKLFNERAKYCVEQLS